MAKLHRTAAKLLADIEAYRARVGIDRTAFGKQAAGDGHFIQRVEAGKIPRLTTIDKVYDYMDGKTKAVRKAARRAAPLLLLAMLAAPALADDGLTKAQRAQIADPANPQFEPLPALAPDPVIYVVPVIPGDEHKAWALKRAFQLNGNSMVGNNHMVDVSGETPFANAVAVERITVTMPVTPKDELNPLDRMVSVTDTCKRHGLHRVTTHGGKSWRCK